MANPLEKTFTDLTDCKKHSSASGEYWLARDLQGILGYSKWSNFLGVIQKAMMACEKSGAPVSNHFADTGKMVEVGSGAEVTVQDFFLSRYACYLVAMNGDPSKQAVAAAQTYFAFQTRRQEIFDQATDDEQRLILRDRVKDANRKLAGVARQKGVQRMGIFQDAGYRGLYEMSLPQIKRAKGIGEKENLLDRVGRMELAANEFRITQTEDKLVRDGIASEEAAIVTHRDVGKEVRTTIKKIGGTMPEALKAEPPIKEIKKRVRVSLKAKKLLGESGADHH